MTLKTHEHSDHDWTLDTSDWTRTVTSSTANKRDHKVSTQALNKTSRLAHLSNAFGASRRKLFFSCLRFAMSRRGHNAILARALFSVSCWGWRRNVSCVLPLRFSQFRWPTPCAATSDRGIGIDKQLRSALLVLLIIIGPTLIWEKSVGPRAPLNQRVLGWSGPSRAQRC